MDQGDVSQYGVFVPLVGQGFLAAFESVLPPRIQLKIQKEPLKFNKSTIGDLPFGNEVAIDKLIY
jgi:hypothetical protein